MWLIIDRNDTESIYIRAISTHFLFDTDNIYHLFCIYAYIDHENEDILNHNKGIFCLNSKFCMVNDLTIRCEEIDTNKYFDFKEGSKIYKKNETIIKSTKFSSKKIFVQIFFYYKHFKS